MRKDISEKIKTREVNLLEDFTRIDFMFCGANAIGLQQYRYLGSVAGLSLEQYIDKFLFKQWSYRGRYISITDARNDLGITREAFSKAINLGLFLTYVEFVSNMLLLLSAFFDKTDFYYTDESCIETIMGNINNTLERLNYKKVFNEDKILIIEKDPAATAVAEIYDDVADIVLEYKRYLLRGNLGRKSQIIATLGKKIEPARKHLKANGFSALEDDISFILNNLNIRHNNIDGDKANPVLAKMVNGELERWYDRVYDMLLLSMLFLNYIEMKDEIKILRQGLIKSS